MKAGKTRYHLQNRWSEMTTYIKRYHLCYCSKLPGSEMTTDDIKYHLQRWRLAFHDIISRIVGERWLRILWGIISAIVVTSLGQRWRLTISSIISRDEGLLFKVSSPEMMERFSRYHLQRWRLAFHDIISRIVGQRWLCILWCIITRDEGWENMVSSPQLLNSSWVRDDGVQY